MTDNTEIECADISYTQAMVRGEPLLPGTVRTGFGTWTARRWSRPEV